MFNQPLPATPATTPTETAPQKTATPETRTRGKFIVIEGPEGGGKTTNLNFLKQLIETQNIRLHVTREPGGTVLGEQLRDLLLHHNPSHASTEPSTEPSTETSPANIQPLTELLMMFAARTQHLHEKIKPALQKQQWVLSDRFTDASFAYQGGGRGIPDAWITHLADWAQQDLSPDWVVVLDVPIAISLARARARGQLDRFESETPDFFERVRAAYLARAALDPARYTVIDGSQPLVAVQTAIETAWQSRLAHWIKTE